MTAPDLVVVGAGVIGLSVAWGAAGAGMSVMVCDPEPARGASWAAAGMLAPVTEARQGEQALLALAIESASLWPGFAAQLEEEAGLPVGLRREPTLSVAFGPDDYRALLEAVEVQRSLGADADLVSGRQCRQLEPSLNPRVVGGALHPGDHQVDNRALLTALLGALGRRGVEVRPVAVAGVVGAAGRRVTGVQLADGSEVPAEQVVVAAGCRSARIGGFAPEDVPAVHPVKGQILRLAPRAGGPGVLGRTVRGEVQGRHVYLVPRQGGEVVVGATMEDQGFDTTVTAGAVHDLLRAAIAVVPDVGELGMAEATARLRPGSPDNGPLLGPTTTAGLHMATGHHRNGILLSPVTRDVLVRVLQGEPLTGAAAAFSALRFSPGALAAARAPALGAHTGAAS